MNFNSCSRIGIFLDTLQKEVDNAYYSSSTDNFEVKIDLPGIDKICFANLSASITGVLIDYEQLSRFEFKDGNTFLIPPEKSCGIDYKKINHLDLSQTIISKNPYCISVSDGSLFLKKDYTSKGVTIK